MGALNFKKEEGLCRLGCWRGCTAQAEAEARIGKTIKFRTGSYLDPLCRIILVGGSGLGLAFGTGWCVYTLLSEEVLWLLYSGSSRNNEADALALLWLQRRSRKNSFPCFQALPVWV